MKMKSMWMCFSLWWAGFVLLVAGLSGAAAQGSLAAGGGEGDPNSQSGAAARGAEVAAPAALPGGVLGRVYVDIHHGFSVRGPAGSVLRNWERVEWAPALLQDWDVLKQPASKGLVGFVEPKRGLALAVSLLVARQNQSMEEMTAARQRYWEKYPNKATVEMATPDAQ